jgi:hypothetical protein
MMLRHPNCGTGRTGWAAPLVSPAGRALRPAGVPIGEEIMPRENLSGAVSFFAIIAALALALLLWALLSSSH